MRRTLQRKFVLTAMAEVSEPDYASGLFDASTVHTIDITMEDWAGFLETCENEEYAMCTAVIDGETVQDIAIRAKGNTSLSSVKQYGNDRYSFKIEFDHYQEGGNYQGLDKLSLNNIIQDNTYMKDYLTYQMMEAFGVDSPLCSYVYLTVNGEDWGLYLAVEAVEESFLERNYGGGQGELYKPDSMDMGGAARGPAGTLQCRRRSPRRTWRTWNRPKGWRFLRTLTRPVWNRRRHPKGRIPWRAEKAVAAASRAEDSLPRVRFHKRQGNLLGKCP